MATNYVLVDFENVQPNSLDALSRHPFKVIVFVGSQQARVSFNFVMEMQKLGNNGQYVKIAGNGKNALDFHIAYYIGKLASDHPKAAFYIISKDKGFDPLIEHLKEKKITIWRGSDLAEIPALRMTDAAPVNEQISAIVKNLAGRGQSRPRKTKTLANTITFRKTVGRVNRRS